jgi:hypothetical protein
MAKGRPGKGKGEGGGERPDTIEVTNAPAREPEASPPGEPRVATSSLEETRAQLLAQLAARRRRRPAIHYMRVATANRRILGVLERRVVAYSRELERQVCEVGFNFATAPPGERPEPVHYGEALRALEHPDTDDEEAEPPDPLVLRLLANVIGKQIALFTLNSGSRADKKEALDRKLVAIRAYLRVEAVPEMSGWHAERVHHEAMTADGNWFSVGWKAGVEIRQLHNRTLSAGSVDLAGVHLPTGVPIVVEVKNRREWFYETDDVVWALLGAAAELEALPVLITRRVPETLFKFMKAVGGIAYPVTKLILPPEAEHAGETGEPSFAEATRELGFHSDIDYLPADGALPRHRALWQRALPREIEERYARFMSLADEVHRLAFDERMRLTRGRPKAADHAGLWSWSFSRRPGPQSHPTDRLTVPLTGRAGTAAGRWDAPRYGPGATGCRRPRCGSSAARHSRCNDG